MLLIRRARPPLEGLWTFPGGHVEPGETVAAAVLREVREETGLTVSIVGGPLLHEIILAEDGRLRSHHVLLVHAAVPLDARPPVAASDAAEARFASPAEAADLRTTDRLAHFIAETRRLVIGAP